MLDVDIEAGRYARHIKFKREKLEDKERLTLLLGYVVEKLRDRFKYCMATNPIITISEYDGDNFVNNLITARISFEYIIFGDPHLN